MPPRPERAPSPSGYLLKFGLTAGALVGLTLILVLVILPRRYVLHAGLREAGNSFPTTAAPFTPPSEMRQEARPLPAPPPAPVVKGPAEVFWELVRPFLAEGGNPARSLPIFQEYLESYPEDFSVWREYATTLTREGRAQEAIPVWRRLLAHEEDPALRLLLARTLRDLGQWEEASTEYALLADQRPEDGALALEWARALAWSRQYERAEEILGRALEADPTSPELRLELARSYYASGKLHESARILDELEEEALASQEAEALRAGVTAALEPPEVVDSIPPSLRERAEQALGQKELETAAALYQEAVAADPQDSLAWRGYADLLQYHLEDLDRAREALLRVEALGNAGNPAFRFRMAQVELWTGHSDEAEARLRALIGEVESGAATAPVSDSTAFGTREVAEARALLGDLARWRGDRLQSAEAYEMALDTDSTNLRARQGMEELTDEWARRLAEDENEGLRATVYVLGDSDDFSRLDLGVEGIQTRGSWIFGARGGRRRLAGNDLFGSGSRELGSFLELESGRWWRWGTLRTGLKLGLEEVRPGSIDWSLGASLRWPSLGGFRSDVSYEHGLAYPLTTTLQSVYARVVQDRLTATFARQLSRRWDLTVAADATVVRAAREASAGGERTTLRAETGISLGRSLTSGLVVGLNARALTYTRPAPRPKGLSLFWDPRGVVSGGLYAQIDREIANALSLRARLNPALAFLDERGTEGWDHLPHLSAEAGLTYRGRLLQSTLDGFYYRGRFDGYQAYGIRLTFSATPGRRSP